MTQKVTEGISSPERSCNSKRSTAKAVRVVHISNPTMVKASASEFLSVVQSLTGRKRSSPSNKDEEMSFDRHDQYSLGIKIPKLHQDGSQCFNNMKCLGLAPIVDNPTVSRCCIERGHGDITIFEELELQPIGNSYDVFSLRGSERVESMQDARSSVVDLPSPTILFSEFENLQKA